jgi:hypothetical protein
MVIQLKPTSARLARWTKPLPRLAVGGAWFFVLFSLAHLAWVIGAKWGDPAGLTTLYQTTVGEETYRAWGLAYAGTLGLLLAIAQAVVVGAAAVMSLRSRPKTRRIGHAILITWAALWTLNLVRLAGLDLHLDSFCQATIMTLLLGSTVYRAARGPSSRLPAPATNVYTESTREQVVRNTRLTAQHIVAATELTDITPSVRRKRWSPGMMPARLRKAGVRAARATKPLARTVGRTLAAGGRRLRHYLHDKGVIPSANRSTSG